MKNGNREFLLEQLHAIADELQFNSIEVLDTVSEQYTKIWLKRMELTRQRVGIFRQLEDTPCN